MLKVDANLLNRKYREFTGLYEILNMEIFAYFKITTFFAIKPRKTEISSQKSVAIAIFSPTHQGMNRK